MSDAEQFGKRLGQLTTDYPRTTRIVVALIFVLILVIPLLIIWRQVADGEWFKVVILAIIPVLGGWRAYHLVRKQQKSAK